MKITILNLLLIGIYLIVLFLITTTAQPIPPSKSGSVDVCCWIPSATDGYLIYYRTDNGKYGTPLDFGSVGHAVVNGLMIGRKYDFEVEVYRLTDRNNLSVLSNEVYFIAK